MDRSESLVELTKALNKFQATMKSVKKESVNPFFKSKYADLDAIWEGARKPLTDNDLAIAQGPTEIDGKLVLETLLLHVSGEYISSRYPLVPMRQTREQGWALSDDPQSLGSAITYARRYALSAMLGISADEDDDAEAARKRAAASRETAAPESKSRKPLAEQAQELLSAGEPPSCPCGDKRVYRSGLRQNGSTWRGWMCPTGKDAPIWIESDKATPAWAAPAEPSPQEEDEPSADPRGDPTQLTPKERRMEGL